jgi:N6-L-threonylcarbamoyladenine synthase
MSDNHHLILAIESSCDDTSAAVLQDTRVLSNIVAGQSVHQLYGGVVPELASRAHQQNIIPVVHTALQKAEVTMNQINAIAVTLGPGLPGSLHVGVSFAKSLCIGLDIPFIVVNHMQAHILAHFIDDAGAEKPEFPFLCLTVSGGHTQIVLVESAHKMQVIGKTIDDAAGEAFDKAAKLLGLPYPGGPLVDRQAKNGNPDRFRFPHPKISGLDYSFSGLKTSLLYFLRDSAAANPNFISENLSDICAGYQNAIISFLLNKLKKAAAETGINRIAIAGGVSANSSLREELNKMSSSHGWKVYIPKFEYCTDNAAMIGAAAYFKLLNSDFANLGNAPQSRMPF